MPNATAPRAEVPNAYPPNAAAAAPPRVNVLGVGAAFDFLSGAKRQAPRWAQRAGLEWAFRLASEPRRLWRRYLRNNPAFAWEVALQAAGVRRYALDERAG